MVARHADTLGMYLAGDALRGRTPTGERVVDDSFLLVLHGGGTPGAFVLPGRPWARGYRKLLDTSAPKLSEATRAEPGGWVLPLAPRSLVCSRPSANRRVASLGAGRRPAPRLRPWLAGTRSDRSPPETWDAFADLAERHNGVWGGCWCTWFHTFESEKTHTVEGNRALKEQLVRDGRAHAALVFDGEVAVGWCEYGTPEELPNINHRKEYEQGWTSPPTTG